MFGYVNSLISRALLLKSLICLVLKIKIVVFSVPSTIKNRRKPIVQIIENSIKTFLDIKNLQPYKWRYCPRKFSL